jgi:hypothetical protein
MRSPSIISVKLAQVGTGVLWTEFEKMWEEREDTQEDKK